MKDNIEIADPEDVAAARAWAARHAAAAAELNRARARRAVLADNLGRDPAAAALAALAVAERATVDASDALQRAETARREAVDRAARYEANDVATAQQALDDATRAVSDALARLLSEASASTALTATVDGLALRARYQAAITGPAPLWDVATIPFRANPGDVPLDPELVFPAVGEPEFERLLALLRQLDDRVDAIADLVTAEGVHQLVNGNPVRSGAALEIAASGAVPDELDVIRTPRSGRDLTHRLLVVARPGLAAAWTGAAPGAAALSDPDLAAWVSTLLPDPAQVHVSAHRIDPQTGEAGASVALRGDVVGLDPLAWLRLSADPAEVSARFARAARGMLAASLGEDAHMGRVVVGDPAARLPGELVLSDLLAAADSVRGVLATARALEPRDFVPPAAEPPAIAADVVARALERLAAAQQSVDDTIAALEAAAAAAEVDPVLDALLAAAALGIGEATPPLDAEVPTLAAAQAQAAVALARVRARVYDHPVAPAAGDPAATLAAIRERLVTLTGSRQLLLTPVAAPGDAVLRADLGAGAVRLAGAAPPAVRDWLRDHARVRPAAAALQRAYDVSETLGCVATLDLRATQSPAADADRWVEDDPAPSAPLDLVVARAYAGDMPDTVTGLAVDAWTTTVPAGTHATGLAFHYDEPDATPPQAILVAVAPDVRPGRQPGTWDLDTLLEVVRSSFALARERAAASDLLPDATITLPDLT
jgi:hypothetical protein